MQQVGKKFSKNKHKFIHKIRFILFVIVNLLAAIPANSFFFAHRNYRSSWFRGSFRVVNMKFVISVTILPHRNTKNGEFSAKARKKSAKTRS